MAAWRERLSAELTERESLAGHQEDAMGKMMYGTDLPYSATVAISEFQQLQGVNSFYEIMLRASFLAIGNNFVIHGRCVD